MMKRNYLASSKLMLLGTEMEAYTNWSKVIAWVYPIPQYTPYVIKTRQSIQIPVTFTLSLSNQITDGSSHQTKSAKVSKCMMTRIE